MKEKESAPCEGCIKAGSCGIQYDAEVQGMKVTYCVERTKGRKD